MIWIVALVLFGALLAFNISTTGKIYEYIFRRKDIVLDEDKASENFKDYVRQAITVIDTLPEGEEQTITSKDGLKLYGTYYRTEGSKKVVFLSHGYHAGGMYDMARFVPFYRNNGYSCVVVDHRSHGKSEGVYTTMGVLEQEDCLDWLDKILEDFGENIEIVLHGVSMGASVCGLMAGNKRLPKQVKRVVMDSGFESVISEIAYQIGEQTRFPVELTIWLLQIFTRSRGKFSMNRGNVTRAVRKSPVPVLFIHGTEDKTVPLTHSKKMFEECDNGVRFFEAENMKHVQAYVYQKEKYEYELQKFLKGEFDEK